jgi:hypothetical protein
VRCNFDDDNDENSNSRSNSSISNDKKEVNGGNIVIVIIGIIGPVVGPIKY